MSANNKNSSVVSTDTEQRLSFKINSDRFFYPRQKGGIFQRDIRKLLQDLYEKGYLPPAEIKNLQSKDHSKTMFGISYPLIVKNKADTKDSKGRSRYWTKSGYKPIPNYYVCSQWWKQNFSLYLDCMKQNWVPHLKEINH